MHTGGGDGEVWGKGMRPQRPQIVYRASVMRWHIYTNIVVGLKSEGLEIHGVYVNLSIVDKELRLNKSLTRLMADTFKVDTHYIKLGFLFYFWIQLI
jgi:hypothetical protein